MSKLLGWLRKSAPEKSRPLPAVPPGQRVYAIGDVHGRLDLLEALLDRIEADDRGRSPAETHVVMLGDLIDRGAQSAGVVDRLLNRAPAFARFHFILGNHEEMLLRQIDEPDLETLDPFLSYGGQETFASYGVPEQMMILPERYGVGAITAYIPAEHIDFLRSFEEAIRFGDYLFVHAGIRPGIAIEEQRSADLRWIRSPFLESAADHGVMVVHGHTIVDSPDIRTNRIGIDTGAYATGVLTGLGLEGEDRWLIATGKEG